MSSQNLVKITCPDQSIIEIGAGGATQGKGVVVIAGPCVIESRDHLFRHAEFLKNLSQKIGFKTVFKSSYDKANRTSHTSFRGPGIEEGLKYLAEVRQEFELPVITDVHSVEEVKAVGQVADIIQIPAFLCRQSDLLEAAARTMKPVSVKKGQFVAPEDMQHVAKKIVAAGNKQVLLCERGTCFGYHDLVVDFRSLLIMQEFGFPIVYDATHSVQSMGGASGKSGGRREFVFPLARAAVAIGIDALFFEFHESPDTAPSDGPNMVPMSEVEDFISGVLSLDSFIKTV